MKLKDQVCSLKLAKKLKKLGVKQESYFYWVRRVKEKGGYDYRLSTFPNKKGKFIDYYSAFTVAELGEMLLLCFNMKIEGRWVNTQISSQELTPKKGKGFAYTVASENEEVLLEFYENTEANARAKMLIYLIENKLIKL